MLSCLLFISFIESFSCWSSTFYFMLKLCSSFLQSVRPSLSQALSYRTQYQPLTLLILCLCISVFFSVSVNSIALSVSICHSVTVYLSLCLIVYLYLSLSLCVCLCSACLSFPSFSFSQHLSDFLFPYLFLCTF